MFGEPEGPAALEATRRRSWALALGAFGLIAAARLLTMAPDPWEWDEVLFVEAVDHGLDLRRGFPHAPGYPLFVEAARMLHLAGVEAFRATTLVGTLGSLLAPVGLSGLLLALGLSLPGALFAGLLYAFLPPVWIHGVRPLTDGPATAALLLSAAALIASRQRGRRWLVGGALLAALCAGLRPQAAVTLLPLCLWAALRLWRERRDRAGVLLALAVAVAASAVIWVPAVQGSGGIASFLGSMKAQADYVRTEDALTWKSFLGSTVWRRWFVDPLGPRTLFRVLALFSVAGIAAAPRRAGTLLLVFAPVVLLTVPFSAIPAASRYVVILLPLPCALAALAVEHAARLGAAPKRVAVGLAALLVAASAAVSAGPVLEVARTESPAVAVVRRLRDDPAFGLRPAYVGSALMVHLNRYLSGRGVEILPESWPPRLDRRARLIGLADDLFLGRQPLYRASLRHPLIGRVTRDRYVAAAIYDVLPEIGLPVIECRGTCWFDGRKGESEIRDGGALAVSCTEGPIRVSLSAVSRSDRATIEVRTGEESLVASGQAGPVDFEAFPDQRGVLFVIRAASGVVRLNGFKLSAAPRPRGAEDGAVSGTVDRPGRDEEVKGTLVVAGRGTAPDGREVEAAEFRLDGIRVDPASVALRAVPTGPGDLPGFEATIPRKSAREGNHLLGVVLRSRDGRSEVEVSRPFRWVD